MMALPAPERTSKVISHMLGDVKQTTISPAIMETTAPGTVVHTDESNIDARLPTWGYSPRTVCHAAGGFGRYDNWDGLCKTLLTAPEGFRALRRTRLRPHRGISQGTSRLCRQRRRSQALLRSLSERLAATRLSPTGSQPSGAPVLHVRWEGAAQNSPHMQSKSPANPTGSPMGRSTIVTPMASPTIMSTRPATTAMVWPRNRSPVSSKCRTEVCESLMAALSQELSRITRVAESVPRGRMKKPQQCEESHRGATIARLNPPTLSKSSILHYER